MYWFHENDGVQIQNRESSWTDSGIYFLLRAFWTVRRYAWEGKCLDKGKREVCVNRVFHPRAYLALHALLSFASLEIETFRF